MADDYRFSRAASCEGKQRFESARLANEVAERRGRPEKRKSYRCKHCGRWHLATLHHGEPHRAKRPRLYAETSFDAD